MNSGIIIAPSILAADFGDLSAEVNKGRRAFFAEIDRSD